MDKNIEKKEWMNFIKDFNKKNQSRTSKLEQCDETGLQMEVKRLPLVGLDLQMEGKNCPQINVIMGDTNPKGRHYSHDVDYVKEIRIKVGEDGYDEALEIVSRDSSRTLLFFESLKGIGR